MSSSRAIYGEYSAEITEKKSRFISIARGIKSESDAKKFLSDQRKIYYDARHIVYAYVLNNGEKKYSDDGEPAKTAGLPVLRILEHEKLTFSLVAVVRYFGGILLGTGGLVRAYSSAAKKVLSQAKIIENQKYEKIIINVKYECVDKINRALLVNGCVILDCYYGSDVKIIFCVHEEQTKKILDALAGFNNFCLITNRSKIFGAVIDKKFVCCGE